MIDDETFLVKYDYDMPVTKNLNKAKSDDSKKTTKIKVVVQRVNKASLLMDNEKKWRRLTSNSLYFTILSRRVPRRIASVWQRI